MKSVFSDGAYPLAINDSIKSSVSKLTGQHAHKFAHDWSSSVIAYPGNTCLLKVSCQLTFKEEAVIFITSHLGPISHCTQVGTVHILYP